MDKQKLDQIHKNLPVDYYEQGMKNNIFQKIWHKRKIQVVKNFLDNMNIGPESKVLDLGCHSGDFTNILASLTKAKVYGADISKSCIDYARKRFPNIVFACSDISEEIHFECSLFDIITIFDVIEHIIDIDTVFRHINKLLKRDGCLLLGITTENWLFRMVWFLWLRLRGRVWRETHVNTLKPQDIGDFLRKYGFSIISHKFSHLKMWQLLLLKKEIDID